MNIKNLCYKWLHSQYLLSIFWPPKKEGHDVTGNRPGPWVSTRKLFICVRVWSSSHQFPRTPFNILAKHLPVFLGTPFSNLAEHLSLCLPWSTNKLFFFIWLSDCESQVRVLYNEHAQYWWCIWEYCVTFWLVTREDGVWIIRSKELWYRWLSGFENNWFFSRIFFKWLLAKSITCELKS